MSCETPIVHFSFLQPVFNCQRTLVIAKISAERNRSIVLTADPCGFLLARRTGDNGRRTPFISPRPVLGGADRDRTDDPLLAKQVLSHLSYSPGPKVRGQKAEGRSQTR